MGVLFQNDDEERIREIERVKQKRLEEEHASENYVKKECKSCPNCKANIQKIEGCNHMICTKCQVDFCWLCLTILPKKENPNDEQEHFVTSECKLFHYDLDDLDNSE